MPIHVINARWRLFGHTLRLNENTPARMSMAYYYVKDMPGRKGNRTTVPSALSSEYKGCFGHTISNPEEFKRIVEYAQDRIKWREIVEQVVSRQHNLYSERIERRTEARHAMKRKREEQETVLCTVNLPIKRSR